MDWWRPGKKKRDAHSPVAGAARAPGRGLRHPSPFFYFEKLLDAHPDPEFQAPRGRGCATRLFIYFFDETLSFLVRVFTTHTKGEEGRRKKKDDDRSARSIAEGGGGRGRGGEGRGSRQGIDPSDGPDPDARGRFSSLVRHGGESEKLVPTHVGTAEAILRKYTLKHG